MYRHRAMILSPVLLLAACSSSDDDDAWRGYYYANVLSNAAPVVSGPYANGPQCVATMHALLRQAPSTANFTCARGCQKASNGVISDCKEATR